MCLRDKISSPLEAGPSLLDAHNLPPQLTPALEYASARLARKSLHLTLVVARRDYQLPPSPVLLSPVGSPPGAASPSQNVFAKHLPSWTRRHASFSTSSSTAASSMPNSPRSVISSSPSYTPKSLEFPRNQQQAGALSPQSPMWPLTPMTPMTPLSPPPMTPSTAKFSSSSSSSASSYHSQYGFPMASKRGLRLIHHANLPPKAEKALQAALAKASRKAGGAGTHIAPALNATTCGFTSALINNSVTQNDVLFSSDGLSLVSFDRLYSLKAALSSYSKTNSPLRLEDAVDELRRYVLASGGNKVSKADLLRSYDWLSVSNSALADLDRMYRRAYGGVEYAGGIEGMYFGDGHLGHEPSSVWSDDEEDDDDDGDGEGDGRKEHDFFHDEDSGVHVEDGLPDSPTVDPGTIGLAVSGTATPVPILLPKRTPSPNMPLLRLQTSFAKTTTEPPNHQQEGVDAQEAGNGHGQDDGGQGTIQPDGEEEDIMTARPDDSGGDAMASRYRLWRDTHQHQHQDTSIDQILSAGPDPPPPEQWLSSSAATVEAVVPMTPNGYDDISPITRGEWGFLLVDDRFQGARTVAVETF